MELYKNHQKPNKTIEEALRPGAADLSGVALMGSRHAQLLSALAQVLSRHIHTLGTQNCSCGHTELLSGHTELLSGYTELLSGQTELLSRRTELLSGQTELFSRRTELFSRQTELLSGHAELFCRHTDLLSGYTEYANPATSCSPDASQQSIWASLGVAGEVDFIGLPSYSLGNTQIQQPHVHQMLVSKAFGPP